MPNDSGTKPQVRILDPEDTKKTAPTGQATSSPIFTLYSLNLSCCYHPKETDPCEGPLPVYLSRKYELGFQSYILGG